jgi:hypothetical protein
MDLSTLKNSFLLAYIVSQLSSIIYLYISWLWICFYVKLWIIYDHNLKVEMIVFPLMLKGKKDLYYYNPQASSILGCQIIN